MNDKMSPEFRDLDITCIDCGQTFIFSAGEQGFFWSKGLAEPKRCPECRRVRKATLVRDYSNRRGSA